MQILRLIPAALALLVLSAHFLRWGSILVLIPLILLVMVFIRQRWAVRLVQAGLLLGCLEWTRTLVLLLVERRNAGLPFARMALILGVVALVTGASALILPRGRTSGAGD